MLPVSALTDEVPPGVPPVSAFGAGTVFGGGAGSPTGGPFGPITLESGALPSGGLGLAGGPAGGWTFG